MDEDLKETAKELSEIVVQQAKTVTRVVAASTFKPVVTLVKSLISDDDDDDDFDDEDSWW
jgi:hypothetical protein